MYPKPDKKIPALYGGIIMGLISSIPFVNMVNCFCCAGILLGGVLAVMFYKNTFTPDTPPLSAGDCLTVGVLAGLVGAVVETILGLLFVALFGNVTMQFVADLVRNSNMQVPPELMEKLEEALSRSASAAHVILNFFFVMILNSVFGMLGGLLGYTLFKPKVEVLTPPPPPPAAPQMGL